MGIGHAARCAALAAALKTVGCDVRFVVRDLGLAYPLADPLVRLPAPVGDVPADDVPHASWAGVGWQADADETIAALTDDAPDWVVVDHYAFDARWHAAVRASLDCRLVVIDDLADRNLDADILIDHNFATDHRTKYAGRVNADTRILGGPRFALIGTAYAEAARYAWRECVESIGVFMGGVDAGGHSAGVLDAIDAAGFSGAVEIATTSANPHLDTLRARAGQRPKTTLAVDLPDLASFFARHDVQVGAGGGATWERCCIGAPTIAVVVADNQRASIPALATTGVIVAATPETLTATIGTLVADGGKRHALGEAGRRLVDGRGAVRAAGALAARSLFLRPATPDDARRAFDWRNDPATRTVSRNAAALDWDAHAAWFDQALADPTRQLFVGYVGDVPVGFIRLDKSDGHDVEVSLYLDPALHGLGLGGPLLRAVEPHVPDGAAILAEVLGGNETSARLFAANGYRATVPGHWRKDFEELGR